ncbi:unnamed protein product [Adineta steineri]|uniref:Uncharacterized protein n=1 Tax=Adineta steineri TaxID=433720 RepID=A0A819VX23_9BILA|nr:unnamed protein product [Adineta steineri]CAF4115664.1 unnamed protein product [Adineta steineri]
MELLRLVFALRTCGEKPSSVFLSIYESGSQDATPLKLDLLAAKLRKLGVPHRIVTRGKWTRSTIKPRIQHLAKVRNAVLQPLYQQPSYTYTQIIFLNDVLFCTEDVLTLVQSQVQTKALLHCGLDFAVSSTHKVHFYDVWVMRDHGGRQFHLPFIYPWFNPNDKQSISQVLRGDYRIPAFCCWNGLAILSTRPFYEFNYRFRSGQYEIQRGLCDACEISHLCADWWALYGNQTRIFVNPSVHVAYESSAFETIQETHWFNQSMIKQSQFQKQLTTGTIPEQQSVRVPADWECVPTALALKLLFQATLTQIRVIDKSKASKRNYIRNLLAFSEEWHNDSQLV